MIALQILWFFSAENLKPSSSVLDVFDEIMELYPICS